MNKMPLILLLLHEESLPVQELDDEAMANVPRRKKKNIQKHIQWRRCKHEGYLLDATSVEIILPEEFKTVAVNGNTESFLLSDVVSDSKRKIIFASETMFDQFTY